MKISISSINNISDTPTEQESTICLLSVLLFILGRNANFCGTVIFNMIGLFTRPFVR